jgi:hypothetical protein
MHSVQSTTIGPIAIQSYLARAWVLVCVCVTVKSGCLFQVFCKAFALHVTSQFLKQIINKAFTKPFTTSQKVFLCMHILRKDIVVGFFPLKPDSFLSHGMAIHHPM